MALFSWPRYSGREVARVLPGLVVLLTGSVLHAQAPAEVTFSRDIAPIVFAKCANCHRPDGSAPFSLVTFADAVAHGRQIVAVTKSRYMPPWRPEPGFGEFAGERRLTDDEIALIDRWVASGAREGEKSLCLPPAPKWSAGWQVGQPDLVLTLPEYIVPATGETDLYRNFVIDVPSVLGVGSRYVRGLEFLPGNTNVHHANIFVDRTSASRKLDDEDPQAGYTGLIPNAAMFPDGHFLGWTPGQAPPLAPEGLAWRLDDGVVTARAAASAGDRQARTDPPVDWPLLREDAADAHAGDASAGAPEHRHPAWR